MQAYSAWETKDKMWLMRKIFSQHFLLGKCLPISFYEQSQLCQQWEFKFKE